MSVNTQASFRSNLPEARGKYREASAALGVSAPSPIEIRIMFCRPGGAVGHDVGCVGGKPLQGRCE